MTYLLTNRPDVWHPADVNLQISYEHQHKQYDIKNVYKMSTGQKSLVEEIFEVEEIIGKKLFIKKNVLVEFTNILLTTNNQTTKQVLPLLPNTHHSITPSYSSVSPIPWFSLLTIFCSLF